MGLAPSTQDEALTAIEPVPEQEPSIIIPYMQPICHIAERTKLHISEPGKAYHWKFNRMLTKTWIQQALVVRIRNLEQQLAQPFLVEKPEQILGLEQLIQQTDPSNLRKQNRLFRLQKKLAKLECAFQVHIVHRQKKRHVQQLQLQRAETQIQRIRNKLPEWTESFEQEAMRHADYESKVVNAMWRAPNKRLEKNRARRARKKILKKAQHFDPIAYSDLEHGDKSIMVHKISKNQRHMVGAGTNGQHGTLEGYLIHTLSTHPRDCGNGLVNFDEQLTIQCPHPDCEVHVPAIFLIRQLSRKVRKTYLDMHSKYLVKLDYYRHCLSTCCVPCPRCVDHPELVLDGRVEKHGYMMDRVNVPRNMRLLSNRAKLRRCCTCRVVFCSECECVYDNADDLDHSNRTCEMMKEIKEGADPNQVELKRCAKCPGCNVPVWKFADCNHMTCTCGTHFCYLCFEDLMGGRMVDIHFARADEEDEVSWPCQGKQFDAHLQAGIYVQ